MSEKRPQSTVQPEQIQGLNSPAEDELNLIDLLKFLVRKKVFILAVTSVCTLFAIFYVQSTTPIYRTSVGLLDHKETFSSSSILKQLDLQLSDKQSHSTPISVFERFLFNIKSHEFKKEVFVNGGFQEKFSRETESDTDQSVSAIYNSIKIVEHRKSFYLELEASKPKVTLEFLKALIEATKENVNAEINDIHRSTVKTGINNLSTQIEKLDQQIALHKQMEKEKKAIEIEKFHQKKAIEIEELRQKKVMEIEALKTKIAKEKQIDKEGKEIEIVRLSKALEMAKRMGIKNNNFDKPGDANFPDWFRYGELALEQEIRSLRSKKEEIPNRKNLLAKLKLERLQLHRFIYRKTQIANASTGNREFRA
jgi:LPS O-antigen subunit length determinant protein (WzzB/FepE family)